MDWTINTFFHESSLTKSITFYIIYRSETRFPDVVFMCPDSFCPDSENCK